MIFTLLRRALIVVATPIEIVAAVVFDRETGFGDWCMDREPGDPCGKFLEARAQALAERHEEK